MRTTSWRRAHLSILALVLLGAVPVAARAQVINGASTDDSAYAPRPPARWHPPEASEEPAGDRPRVDDADHGARSEKPRD